MVSTFRFFSRCAQDGQTVWLTDCRIRCGVQAMGNATDPPLPSVSEHPLKIEFQAKLCFGDQRVVSFRFYTMGIVFLLARDIVKSPDLVGEIKAQGYYILTVIAGVLFHGFVILPLTYLTIVRKNPLKFMKGILPAMVTGAATAST